MDTVGVVAFAFGQQAGHRAGPSNEAIAVLVQDIVRQEESRGATVLVVTQWEVRVALPSDFPAVSVSEYGGITHYVDTKYVLDEALQYFGERGVRRIVLLAHPLHLFFISLLLEARVWEVPEGMAIDRQYRDRLRSIPYDRSKGNTQWWTRTPLGFIAYLAKTLVTRQHGA